MFALREVLAVGKARHDRREAWLQRKFGSEPPLPDVTFKGPYVFKRTKRTYLGCDEDWNEVYSYEPYELHVVSALRDGKEWRELRTSKHDTSWLDAATGKSATEDEHYQAAVLYFERGS